FLYIADGHHRSAAAVRVGMEKREENPDYTAEDRFNYFLSVRCSQGFLLFFPCPP
ncbi:MAG TPA: DUF1015 domain-containing protein, partial [Firmicutes bacterium]|nr:DUF1015 domain-containing protein [Bacillota bacterium]